MSVCFEQLLCMKNQIFKLLFLPILFISCNDITENPDYLNMSVPIDKRTEDLMNRMNLYEKACQMNQFVGIEHMKKQRKIYLKRT